MAKNVIVVQASRGWPKKQVFRSPESIFLEVKQNYDLGMQKFAFVDDILNLNKTKSSRFFEMVIKEGLDESRLTDLRGGLGNSF